MINSGSTEVQRGKDRKKKPDEMLSSVIYETTKPAAVDLLISNAPFVFPSGTAWAMLVLAASSIGGLSKRNSRDQAKGSIIELITSDQIKTVATEAMLREEVFGIVPEPETLSRMEEFSLLTGANYTWAVVWLAPDNSLVIDEVNDATFADAQAVAAGKLSLEKAVGDKAWADHSGVDVQNTILSADDDAIEGESAPSADGGDPLFDDPVEVEDFDGPDDDEGSSPDFGVNESDIVFDDGEPEPELDDVDEASEVSATVERDDAYSATAGFAEHDDVDGEELTFAPIAEVAAHAPVVEAARADVVALDNQNDAYAAIARRFLAEGLELDISLEEFNITFGVGAPMVQIAVPDGASDWLGDQVAQLNRQANADLARLHKANEDQLRSLYVRMMSKHAETVIRSVATDKEGSRYKLLKDSYDESHTSRERAKDDVIRARKAEIVADYEAQARRLAEQAALQAEVQFKERNRAKMERDQIDAVAEIERSIENMRSLNMREVLRVRSADATLRMQVGVSSVFAVVEDAQKANLQAEGELMAKWKQEIQDAINDNRQADIQRAQALAEQQRRFDEVSTLRTEHEALLTSLRREHDNRLARMEDELERTRKDAVVQLQACEAEWQHSVNLEKERTSAQVSRVDDLLKQTGSIEESVRRQYEARLADLAADKESYANELTRAAEIQSRYTKMMIGLITALPVLGLMAGFIIRSLVV